MSLQAVSVSQQSNVGSFGVDFNQAQDVIAQLQAAVTSGNPTLTAGLAQTANDLLNTLNDAHAQITASLESGQVPASTASAMMSTLDQIDQDASDIEYALTELGQLGVNALSGSGATANGVTPTTMSAANSGLATPDSPTATSNAFARATTGQNMTGAQFLQMATQTPSILNSLKQYVKSQEQIDMLDALFRALGNASGTDSSSSQSSGGAQARVSAAQPQTSGAQPQTSGAQPQLQLAAPAPQFTTSSINTGAAAPLGGTVSTGTFIPTVSSGVTLTQGGAQAGTGNTASIDGWDANLGLSNPGNIDEFLMMVLLASYEDGQKGLEQMAQQLQKTNNAKKALRAQLSGLYAQTTGNPTTDAAVNAQIQNVQGQLSDASDDAQLQQLQLQNATQNQQELLQEISSFSKNLYDASMNILRKIGA